MAAASHIRYDLKVMKKLNTPTKCAKHLTKPEEKGLGLFGNE